MPGQRLSFGPFEVDEGAQVVLRDGEPLPLGQRGVHLLACLLRRPGEVITKSELIDAAWGGAAVEESNLSVQIAALRKTLGTAPTGSDWIATIPRVGYRFVGGAAAPSPAEKRDTRPSIAVLPFENLSSDPEQSYFADGLAEDIIIGLAKLSGLRVMARNASFAFRDSGIDVRTVAAKLEVGHVLEGSVRRNGDRLRMSVALVDGATGTQLWAERFDRRIEDVFSIQDEVTANVIGALRVKLTPAEAVRPATGGTTSPEALDLLLRGRALHAGPIQNATIFKRTIDLLEKVLVHDPDYAEACGVLALAHLQNNVNRWTPEADRALGKARALAERRVALEPQSAAAHESLAFVADFERNRVAFEREVEQVLALDPNLAGAPFLQGKLCFMRGDPLGAVPHFEEGMRRDPSLAGTIFFLQLLGMAYLYAGRFETAAALFRERIVLMPDTDWSRAYLISALGHLGQYDDARAVHRELMAINPDYRLEPRLDRSGNQLPEQRRLVVEGWQEAGLPTS